ncbi:efflux RND transporter permease subunit [Desertibacillus haloalkaliphilus]|uniref:efflux RND transporter permease subunit n=1 Tax=Desertibacillus haloalkaliphilus TaxID=1328930 RepID=UPI001C25D10A|nr:efflux RND transporter permease subunit [Desertibacillus haloalkaliphilus]MBU8905959.1 efflux RND transporter permease subunit [Desertibacillus haloalkaliphilus]
MKLVDVSVKRPVGVIMIVIAALVLGAISLKNLAIDLFPEMEIPVAVVTTNYDGAAPQEVEQLVSRPVESAVGGIEGVTSVESVSSPGSSLVVLQFDWGRNIDESMNDIRDRIDQVAGMLPDGADRPSILRIDPQQMPVMWIGLSGADPQRLTEIAEDEVEPFFERVSGVASVGLEGGQQREIQVELNRAQLLNYGLTGSQVVQAINTENNATSAGNLTRGSQDLQLRIDGEFTSIEDIEKTPIPLQQGGSVKVSDVAIVNDTYKDVTSKSLVHGEEAIVLSIMKQSDGNTVEVSDAMYGAIEAMQAELEAEGISLSIIIDSADFIRDSIDSVINNMLIGAVMSIAVLLLFLRSIRTTLVIGITIPIAIISTFTLMYFTGETLNILSMGGLALGLGMMVDSAIVIIENIFSKRQQGYSIMEAAREGASELGPAVLASTLTSVAVFVPIVFVEGLAAELFRPLALTVAFALFASLICALTLIPMLSSKMLGNSKALEEEEESRGFNKLLDKLKATYKKVLERALRLRKTVVAVTAALVVGSLALVPFVGFEFIPGADQGQLEIRVTTNTGANLEETESVVHQVQAEIEPYNDIVQSNYVSIGGGGGAPGMGGSSNEATFTIQLVSPSEREMTTDEFVAAIEEGTRDIAGAEIAIVGMEAGMGAGSPIQLNIAGPDLDVLTDLSYQVMWLLEEIDGTTNIDSTVSEGRPELQVVVDRDLAGQYGLSYQQVMTEVSLAFEGQLATQYRTDGREYDVRVILPEDTRQTIRDLETMAVRSNHGVDVPLSAVADFKQVQGPTEINRSNQQREVRVTSDIADRDLGSVNQDIQQRLANVNLPDGYSISVGGDAEDMQESFSQLGLAFILAIFLVYLVMAVQFESFVHPFVVMFSLPTMIIGVFVGLFVTNTPLSVTALIGLIMLAGIVVNNAIVLVSYINILRDKGMDRYEAIIESGISRLRPILMTTMTTALAMVPLALGIGEGAEMQAPMAIVIIFGLLFSMVFTLVLIPVMYVIVDNFSSKVKGLFSRKKDAGAVEIADEKE